MKKPSAARLCYLLLLACFPASMLPVIWLSPAMHDWMAAHARRLYDALWHIYPFLPSWPQYFALQTLAAALLICAAVRRPRPHEASEAARPRPPLLFPALVAGYAAWAGLSCFWSAWPYGTRAYFIRELPFYVLCIAAYFLCGRPGRWRTVARVFVVCAVAEAALQTVIIVASYLGGGVEPPAGRALTLRYVFLKRAIFYSNCNFGSALLLTAGLTAIGLAAGRVSAERPRARQAALLAAGTAAVLAVLGFVFLTAGSLAGLIAAAVGGAAYLACFLPRRAQQRLAALVVVLGLGAAVALLASDRLWTGTARALLSPHRTTHLRVIDWMAAGRMFARRPVHGWGMGTFPAVHARFFPPLARELPFLKDIQTTHPHNEFARIAAEQGAVGLGLYLAILACALTVAFRALRTRPLRERLPGYALWAGSLTFIVQSAFGKAPMNWSFAANQWLLLGVLASARHWRTEPAPAPAAGQAPRTVAGWIALLAVAAGVGWFWWEWALGGYAAMVSYHQAHIAHRRLHEKDGQEKRFAEFVAAVDASRPRFLWPDQIINADYTAGWFLTSQERWAEARDRLQEVQRTVPEFQKTRLLLAECHLNLGRADAARAELAEYIARAPHDMAGYDLLARVDPAEATRALEAHVLPRLSLRRHWIIRDIPETDEVHRLLNLYVQMGHAAAARELMNRVQRFQREDLGRGTYEAADEVRALEARYDTADRPALAARLRRMFPEIWPDDAPAGTDR
ncbi:MAG: O-antigen ligase family protein [Candidatus Brocadiaceae bacterium]|nr:O-antigen ligase family protein [Candidatus Brocadiaceae bacterium]